MSDKAIEIEGLGKRYRYGGAAPLSHNLRQEVTDWFRRQFRLKQMSRPSLQAGANQSRAPSDGYFWALKDVDLHVKQGVVMGIIGRNGAGKSTLLKILSRITPPTTGSVTYHGRVASLLEVGTGFHRELTGRENIFLNGSILGMRRIEIGRKLDEIVAFAEIEKFLDTPVKFYSSGMYVRLAFAVAAHLESEILLVDEVLAVGDAAFQRKCLGKMEQLSSQGRTTLFVSHNMAAVLQLCTRCAWIDNGVVREIGPARETVDMYMRSAKTGEAVAERMVSDKSASITRVTCLNASSQECNTVQMGKPLIIAVECRFAHELKNVSFGISIENSDRQRLFGVTSAQEGIRTQVEVGIHRLQFRLPRLMLGPGEYFATLAILDDGQDVLDWWDAAATFEVVGADVSGSSYIPTFANGLVWLEHQWAL